MDIIYEDNSILAINKPVGKGVQPDFTGDKSVLEMAGEYLNNAEVFIINRLDRPVGGVLIMAKNAKAAAALNKAFQLNETQKYYFAVVLGKTAESAVLEDYIVKDARLNISKISNKSNKHAKKAILEFKRVHYDESRDLSLVKVKLQTGRHHQIRVQFAAISHPIWGDNKYNKLQKNVRGKNIALFCAETKIIHHETKKILTFKLNLPENEPFCLFTEVEQLS